MVHGVFKFYNFIVIQILLNLFMVDHHESFLLAIYSLIARKNSRDNKMKVKFSWEKK